MEILFVSHKYPPATGGMEKQCYELVSGIEKKDTVYRLIYNGNGNKLFFFLSLGRKIRKICKENPGIRIIHYNDGLIAAYCSFLKLPGQIASVVTLHGLDVVFPSRFYHKYIIKRLNRYDCMVAVSRATAEKAVTLGIDPEKVMTIPNGVDTSLVRQNPEGDFRQWLSRKQIDPSGKKILMLMGRPVLRKGFSWFVKKILPAIQEDFFLVIAGPFHFKPTLKERLIYLFPPLLRKKPMLFFGYASDERELRKILKDPARVKHLGRLPYPEINHLLQNVDAFVMPNIRVEGDMEGFGLVCLEAAINGTLVFAADLEGIPDAIRNEENGFLLPSGDEKAWIEKLGDFAKNIDAYQLNRSRFHRFTKENYNWERMVNAYYELFTQLSRSVRSQRIE